MFVKQISIYLENVKGSLREITQLLGDNNIDLKALSIADTMSFGIVRCIVAEEQIEKTMEILREHGNIAKVNNVICVCIPDKPSGLSKVLTLIEDAGISIEYTYSFYKNTGDNAVLIIRPSEKRRTVAVLSENGIQMLNQAEIDKI
ncbi:MAG: ACT domain-containing protein [Clostridia bacterium]|nr:ACT domain-containing protein [Clostridia bacterium]